MKQVTFVLTTSSASGFEVLCNPLLSPPQNLSTPHLPGIRYKIIFTSVAHNQIII